jgi:hypothetical protein
MGASLRGSGFLTLKVESDEQTSSKRVMIVVFSFCNFVERCLVA